MTRNSAEKVIQGLLSASGALNETLRLVQAEASDTVFEDYEDVPRRHGCDLPRSY